MLVQLWITDESVVQMVHLFVLEGGISKPRYKMMSWELDLDWVGKTL